ncbi:MAG: hypothetical protein Q8932_15865, partial [Bacteroidota bacterium]|nr:hypothetical protein [Bacteroidota bacterium]
TQSTLTVSKSKVARGEPLSVTAAQITGVHAVKWTVSPSSGSILFPNKNDVVALFSNAGTYHVTAQYYPDSAGSGAPIDSSSSPITVTDSVYAVPPVTGYDSTPLTGVNLSVMPVTAHDTGGLYLVVSTNTWFSCYPHLNWSVNQSGSGAIDLYFFSVTNQTNHCAGSSSMPATAYIYLYPPANGNHPLTIHMDGHAFAGTLTVSDQNYGIAWPDASRVSWTVNNVSKN